MKFSNKKYVQGVHGHVGLSVALKLHTIKGKKTSSRTSKKCLILMDFLFEKELTEINVFELPIKIPQTLSGMDSQQRSS